VSAHCSLSELVLSWLKKTVFSTVGRKFLVGLTGVGLVGFLIGHLAGNLNLFRGKEAMNAYGHALHEIPGFLFIEIGLLTMFVLHIGLVLWLVVENRAARGSKRYASSSSKRPHPVRALASRTMAFSGLTVLVFTVVHIAQIRLKRASYETAADGLTGHVVDTLAQPGTAILYIIGSLFVGFHVFHGIASAARSLGVHNRKYTPIIERAGVVIGAVIGIGFALIPLTIWSGVVDVSGLTFLSAGGEAASADALVQMDGGPAGMGE